MIVPPRFEPSLFDSLLRKKSIGILGEQPRPEKKGEA